MALLSYKRTKKNENYQFDLGTIHLRRQHGLGVVPLPKFADARGLGAERNDIERGI